MRPLSTVDVCFSLLRCARAHSPNQSATAPSPLPHASHGTETSQITSTPIRSPISEGIAHANDRRRFPRRMDWVFRTAYRNYAPSLFRLKRNHNHKFTFPIRHFFSCCPGLIAGRIFPSLSRFCTKNIIIAQRSLGIFLHYRPKSLFPL